MDYCTRIICSLSSLRPQSIVSSSTSRRYSYGHSFQLVPF